MATIYGFPTENASMEVKTSKQYILDYLRAMYNSKQLAGQSNSDSDIKRIEENRLYAEGLQSVQPYKNVLGIGEGDVSYLNIDYSILPITTKYVNIVVGEMINNIHDVTCTSIDPTSKGKRDKIRNRMIANMYLKKYSQMLEQQTGVKLLPDNEYIPQDIEEVELKMKMGSFKLDTEIAMETWIKWELYNNDWKQIEKQVCKDLVVIKKSAVKHYFDENDMIRVRYADWGNLLVPYCTQEDLSDAVYAGEVVKMTIGQIRRMSAGQLSEEDLFKIAQKMAGRYGNSKWEWGNTYYNFVSTFHQYFDEVSKSPRYDDFLVPVLDGWFKTLNIENWEQKYNEDNGGYFVNRKGADYQPDPKSKGKREVFRKEMEYGIVGKWIVGTDYMFDYGLQENIMRPKEGGRYSGRAMCPYTFMSPGILDMQSKSMVEAMRPHADQIQLIYLKTQQLIAKIQPPGRAVDVEALKEVMLGKGGHGPGGTWTPLQLMQIADQTGVHFYRGVNDDGSPMNRRPIEAVDNSAGNALVELQNAYQFHLQQIRDITGINEARDASTPDKDALVGLQKLALQTSRNATREITFSYVSLLEDAARYMALQIQYNVALKRNLDIYEQALGQHSIDIIEIGKDLPLADMGIAIEVKPTEEEKAILEGNIQQSLAQKEIRIEDAMMIRSIPNIKMATMWLAYSRRRYEKEQQAMRQEDIRVQMEEANRAALEKEQERQKTMQLEVQVKLAEIQAQKQADSELSAQEFEQKKQLLELQLKAKSNDNAFNLSMKNAQA